ncbi:MAG TPA: hypothetical protein HPP77_03395 [Candidatus Hydrogenedentes bacterium]|nr:hypothetical protein [Candidatus Hydrogenedentota bacterium]HIJ72770.1 hypothetical protein [Candidatus Hydrogenedentota bacterium]
MRGGAGYPDCFVVVNGPEDGTEFPIARAPFFIGKDPACAVNVRLDTAVQPIHARCTVVSDGYRIRSKDGSTVLANGKPAGAVRSRIVRSGGWVQVGHTLLVLECSPDGLASRSRGIDTQNDFAWAAREAARKLASVGRGLFRIVVRAAGRLLGSWLGILAVLILLYMFWPWFRMWINYLLLWAYSNIVGAVLRRILSG